MASPLSDSIQRRGQQRDRHKKTIDLISKTTTLHVHNTFLYILARFCATTT